MYAYLLEVAKQQTCMKCSYSASNQFCITAYSSYMSFAQEIVAVHSQDSIRTCKPHAVLAVHCNCYIHVYVYTSPSFSPSLRHWPGTGVGSKGLQVCDCSA